MRGPRIVAKESRSCHGMLWSGQTGNVDELIKKAPRRMFREKRGGSVSGIFCFGDFLLRGGGGWGEGQGTSGQPGFMFFVREIAFSDFRRRPQIAKSKFLGELQEPRLRNPWIFSPPKKIEQ